MKLTVNSPLTASFRSPRKSRVETENKNQTPESPDDTTEENNHLLRRLSESHGLPHVAPASPSQQSVDLDQGQHMPHLICSYLTLIIIAGSL